MYDIRNEDCIKSQQWEKGQRDNPHIGIILMVILLNASYV